MKARTLIFVGTCLLTAALPSQAELCGKVRKATMFLPPEGVPTYRLGPTAEGEIKLGSDADVANFVLAAPKEAASLFLIAGGESFLLKACKASFTGAPQLQAFEVGPNDLPRLTGIIRKTGSAKLRVLWRKKDQTGKVYIAEK